MGMATSGSTEQRLSGDPSLLAKRRLAAVNQPNQPNQPSSHATSTCVPIVVFLSLVFALWAISVMAIGQTVGRAITLPFLAVAAMAVTTTLVVLRHAWRHGLRLAPTLGDGVSGGITLVLALAARGLINWPFLSPLTVADDAARHFGMVNWIAQQQRLPNAPTPDLLQFSEYPMSAHYLAATIARTFAAIPLRVANVLSLGVTYGLWALLGSAVAFAWKRRNPLAPKWQQALAAATVPLVGYALSTLTLYAVTASYFYAQVVGLWFAGMITALVITNPDALLGGAATTKPRTEPDTEPPSKPLTNSLTKPLAKSRATRFPSWWPILAVLMIGPSLVYPLHLVLTPVVVVAVVGLERRCVSAAVIGLGMAALGLGVQLPWLGAATKMSQEEGAILQPSFADLGGLTVLVLLLAGLVWSWRTKTETIGVLTLLFGAAQVGLLVLAYRGGAVSKYTSVKVISSILPGLLLVAAVGAVALANSVTEWFTGSEGIKTADIAPRGFASGGKHRFAPIIGGGLVILALVQAIRFPPLTGLTRPLISADGYRVSRWASAHVDPNRVGIVAPGIEAYALWWTALDRKKDLSVLRKMQPSSTLWSAWPETSGLETSGLERSLERYLIVVTKGQAKSFAARSGVKVLFRSGDAVLLERTK
jgi:hypothetical protein